MHNIWSWHEQVSLGQSQRTSLRVLVDFDNNGRMDTEYSNLRVLVTDVQLSTDRSDGWIKGTLSDSQRVRWHLSTIDSGRVMFRTYERHFSTPLMLPIGSELTVDLVSRSNRSEVVRVNLIGRVVTL